MATWRDRMRPASFNGVEFFVDVSELSGGRRNAIHEFPFKDGDPYVEDLGAKGKDFTVEAFVIGDDYLSQRDDLLAELDRGGPGELHHPHYGVRRVAVGEYNVREAPTTEGGLARFRISFLATSGAPLQPSAQTNGAANVVKSAASAKSAAASAFQAAFSTLTAIHDGVAGTLRGATTAMNGVLSGVSLVTQDAASLQRQVTQFTNGAVALASAPGDLVTTATGIFDAMRDAVLSVPNMTDPLGVFLGIYGFDPGTTVTSATTLDRSTDTANAAATRLFMQRLAVVAAAEVASKLSYTSYEDATAARARVTDLIDQLADATSDDSYPGFAKLRSDLVGAVPGESSDLPHLITLTPPATLPSLVLSYRLYGGSSGEADVIARNAVRHPGFLSGGVELEVLSQ